MRRAAVQAHWLLFFFVVLVGALGAMGCAEPTPAEQVRDQAIDWIKEAPTQATKAPRGARDDQVEYYFSDAGRTVLWLVRPPTPRREGSSGFDPVLREGSDYTANFGGAMGPGALWVSFTAREVTSAYAREDEKTAFLLRLPAVAIIIARWNDPLHILTVMEVDEGIEESGTSRVITGSVGRAARLGDDLPAELVEALKRNPRDRSPVRLVVGSDGEAVSLTVGEDVGEEPAWEYRFTRASSELEIPSGMGLDEWLREVSPGVHFGQPSDSDAEAR